MSVGATSGPERTARLEALIRAHGGDAGDGGEAPAAPPRPRRPPHPGGRPRKFDDADRAELHRLADANRAASSRLLAAHFVARSGRPIDASTVRAILAVPPPAAAPPPPPAWGDVAREAGTAPRDPAAARLDLVLGAIRDLAAVLRRLPPGEVPRVLRFFEEES